MKDTGTVHDQQEKRIARGVRMSTSLWDFVDRMADQMEEGNTTRLIERWVSEKRDAVLEAA